MIKGKPYIVLLMFLFAFDSNVKAQDVHFSQYINTPFMINPALTGLFRGDLRTSLHYRDQWQSISNGFKTYAFSLDRPLLNKLHENNYLGIGLSMYSDLAGSGNYGTTMLNLSLSGIKHLDVRNIISAGFNFSYLQRSLNQSDLTWSNQYDPSQGYNSNLQSDELGMLNSRNNFDLSAGFAWKFRSHNSPNIYLDQFRSRLGFSLFHINTPNVSLIENLKENENIKIVAHGDAWVKMTDKYAFLPSFYFLNQGTHNELIVGTIMRVEVQDKSKYGKINGMDILVGTYYRVGDAIIPTISLRVAKYEISLSYDINISGLTQASQYMGGLEIGFKFQTPNPFTHGGSLSLQQGDQRI